MSAALFLIDFLLGGFMAIVSKLACAPLERAKLLLQNQYAISAIPVDKRYAGIWDVLSRLPAEQGFLSYWRGSLCNLIRYFPTQAFNFAFKDTFGRMLTGLFGNVGASPLSKFTINILKGGLAGAMSLLFVYPLDFAATRLALDVGTTDETREFSGIFDCLYKTISSEGIFGIYAGFFVSVLGIIWYRALYFGLYDSMRVSIGANASHLIKFMMAQMVTMMAGVGSYPLDTIRRRMMLSTGDPKSTCQGTFSCTSMIIQNEGISGLFEGVVANMLRSIFASLVLVFLDEISPLIKAMLGAAAGVEMNEQRRQNAPKAEQQGPSTEDMVKLLQQLDVMNREFLEKNLTAEQMLELKNRRESIQTMVDTFSEKPTEAELEKLTEREQEFETFLKSSIPQDKYEEMMRLQAQFEQVYMRLRMAHEGAHSHEGHSHEGGCCGGHDSHGHTHAAQPTEQTLEEKKES